MCGMIAKLFSLEFVKFIHFLNQEKFISILYLYIVHYTLFGVNMHHLRAHTLSLSCVQALTHAGFF